MSTRSDLCCCGRPVGCIVCEFLIAHQAEVNRLVEGLAPRAGVGPTYIVLGTLASVTWPDGISSGVTIEEVKRDMADFKAYMRVEITPKHWTSKDDATG